ncbi:hypothetical protein X798_03079 [Onchocerca flexuosa]|uniref:Uncharacterized protein n=1 Tax=Onchocerca flexuosa TaxID=387005 RepID=A0A238BXH2_9BILA|nr:hypothetical protein X798_03079 [Onchocerca flexuosa]
MRVKQKTMKKTDKEEEAIFWVKSAGIGTVRRYRKRAKVQKRTLLRIILLINSPYNLWMIKKSNERLKTSTISGKIRC